VLAPGVTVIEFPVPTNVVPQPPVYQYTVPTAPCAVKVADEPTLQIAATEEVIDVGAAGAKFGHCPAHVVPPDVGDPVVIPTCPVRATIDVLNICVRHSPTQLPEIVCQTLMVDPFEA